MSLLPDPDEQVIKEGFLCPVCLGDFPGINDLQAHFNSGIHDEAQDGEEGESAVSQLLPPSSLGLLSEIVKERRPRLTSLHFHSRRRGQRCRRLAHRVVTLST